MDNDRGDRRQATLSAGPRAGQSWERLARLRSKNGLQKLKKMNTRIVMINYFKNIFK
jgi:hypothetical protein